MRGKPTYRGLVHVLWSVFIDRRFVLAYVVKTRAIPHRKGDSHEQQRSPHDGPEQQAEVDMKFEIVVIPVSDVDRAKEFYAKLGWRLDADYDSGKDFRVIQFTPPGSGCSIIFGKNVTAAAPGSSQGMYLIVSDVGPPAPNCSVAASRSPRCSTTPRACMPARTSLICLGGNV